MKDAVNVLMETSPKGLNIDIVTAEIKQNLPEITSISDMHIWEITSGMYALTVHMEAQINTPTDVTEIIGKVKKLFEEKI